MPWNATDIQRMGRLLNLILKPGDLWDGRDLGQMLSHQLTVSIPFQFQPRSLDASRPARTISDALFGADPSPDLLERLKEFAKASQADPDAPLPPEIATILYLASISAAQVRCRTRISSVDNAGLAAGIHWALALEWIPDSLRDLFRDAVLQFEAPASPDA